MKNSALYVAGAIFLLVAFMHLARVLLKVDVVIRHLVMPMGMSLLGFIVAAGLAIWMFKSARYVK